MAIITSSTLIRVLSLVHLVMGYYLITNPRAIADQSMVILLGQAMKLPRTYAFDKPSPTTALLGLLMIYQSICDLTTLSSISPLSAHEYWSTQSPVRAGFFFLLTTYVYLGKSDSSSGKSFRDRQSVGALLQNGLVFSWGFGEVLVWFWVYGKVREERRGLSVQRRGE